jgi:hypothetical protein
VPGHASQEDTFPAANDASRDRPETGLCAPAGRVHALDEFVEVARDPDTGVEYIQHTRAGAELVDGVGQWVFDWVAPDEDVAVVLHIAANSANGDDSPLEDLIYQTSVELRPRH